MGKWWLTIWPFDHSIIIFPMANEHFCRVLFFPLDLKMSICGKGFFPHFETERPWQDINNPWPPMSQSLGAPLEDVSSDTTRQSAAEIQELDNQTHWCFNCRRTWPPEKLQELRSWFMIFMLISLKLRWIPVQQQHHRLLLVARDPWKRSQGLWAPAVATSLDLEAMAKKMAIPAVFVPWKLIDFIETWMCKRMPIRFCWNLPQVLFTSLLRILQIGEQAKKVVG